MNQRLAPRLMSFALATLVTWSIYSGIDTAGARRSTRGATQMSMAASATQVAAAKRVRRAAEHCRTAITGCFGSPLRFPGRYIWRNRCR